MQFLAIDKSTALSDISQVVGSRNTDAVLVANQADRSPNAGERFVNMCKGIAKGLPATAKECSDWINGKSAQFVDLTRQGWTNLANLYDKGTMVLAHGVEEEIQRQQEGYTRIIETQNQRENVINSMDSEFMQRVADIATTPYELLENYSLWQADKIISFGEALRENVIKTPQDVSKNRKAALLNTLTSDSEAYEKACLMSEDEWRVFSVLNTFDSTLRIPSSIVVPSSSAMIGNGQTVSSYIYQRTMQDLKSLGSINPSTFSDYAAGANNPPVVSLGTTVDNSNLFSHFMIPWGEVQLYSSIDDTVLDFPCYPEELEYARVANYGNMEETLYQYEPWLVYESSGPREQSLTFKFHRDMWTGDHRDGKANELVRFCEACCYPEFDGASVNVPTVTLYIHGSTFISGVMTQVQPHWSGPLGLDGWYLACELTLSITEVSKKPLSYSQVRKMDIVGGFTG